VLNVPPPGHIIDNPVWESLMGPHARFAERHGRAVRYQPKVAPFVALEDVGDTRAWADAAELIGPGGTLTLFGVAEPPPGWELVFGLTGVQMVDAALRAVPDPEAVELGPDDVPEILDLVERTKPGPFRGRTVELGTYLGIRRDGKLIAMAGERVHPPGWTEISAVCTDDAYRGQGLATRLILAVAAGVNERGETSFLHALADNTNALRLYEALGFTLRRRAVINTFKKI
jgi:ribosomal protein S18 acetylase RimI-like enzyme